MVVGEGRDCEALEVQKVFSTLKNYIKIMLMNILGCCALKNIIPWGLKSLRSFRK